MVMITNSAPRTVSSRASRATGRLWGAITRAARLDAGGLATIDSKQVAVHEARGIGGQKNYRAV